MTKLDDAGLAAIMSEVGLDEDTLAQRRDFFELDDENKVLLAQVHSWLEEHPTNVGEAFVEKIRSFATTRSLVESHCNTELHHLPDDCLLRITSSEHDLAYAKGALRIGLAHQRIGLAPTWFVGSYVQYVRGLMDRIREMPGIDVEKSNALLHACLKALLFDTTLVLETYFHAEHDKIQQLAELDILTGLPNRYLLGRKLAEIIAREEKATLLMFGLNRFKVVNTTFGHGVGDRILVQVADRFRGICSDESVCARMGGDVFAVLAPRSHQGECDAKKLDRVLTAIEQSYLVDDVAISVGVNAGIAHYPEHGTDPVEIVRKAEAALHHCKKMQDRTCEYTDEIQGPKREQFLLIGELRQAIIDGELELFYQPKVNLATGLATGAEALLRWRHRTRGLIPPGDFIPATEETELIHPVTRWVLEEATRQIAIWQERGLGIQVAVNLAPRNLMDADLPARLGELIATRGISPSLLMVEITERGIMTDPVTVAKCLGRIRDMGVKVSVDDFGTGNSTLVHLKDLPVDELKVDLVFVRSMAKNLVDEKIIESTIGLAHALGLEVAAEGAEDENVIRKLTSMGCERVQGYFYSKPLPAPEFEAWLAKRAG